MCGKGCGVTQCNGLQPKTFVFTSKPRAINCARASTSPWRATRCTSLTLPEDPPSGPELYGRLSAVVSLSFFFRRWGRGFVRCRLGFWEEEEEDDEEEEGEKLFFFRGFLSPSSLCRPRSVGWFDRTGDFSDCIDSSNVCTQKKEENSSTHV